MLIILNPTREICCHSNNPIYNLQLLYAGEMAMSEEATIAQKAPYQTEVEEGKTYYWCACGLSKKQPYCDGSHKDTSFQPLPFTADKTGSVYLCG